MLSRAQVEEVFERFRQRAPGEPTGPTVKEDADHFRALVSCLLSAQSRDENTVRARDALFALADTPDGILALSDASIAAAIKPAGLYNIKTKRVKALCQALLDQHGGVVPQDRATLMKLPGIGRKCADIMLLFSFGEPAIAVDTHVFRVCNRIGLARGKTEAQTAEALDARAPGWAKHPGHMWLLYFGKQTCRSRAPRCDSCFLSDLCEGRHMLEVS
jgi:endonuclease-3